MANSEDLDQTASSGTVWPGSALFAYDSLSETLVFKIVGHLSYVDSLYYENTPIQIYWKYYHQKKWKFSDKNSDIFHISAQNIDCGYSLQLPHRTR